MRWEAEVAFSALRPGGGGVGLGDGGGQWFVVSINDQPSSLMKVLELLDDGGYSLQLSVKWAVVDLRVV